MAPALLVSHQAYPHLFALRTPVIDVRGISACDCHLLPRALLVAQNHCGVFLFLPTPQTFDARRFHDLDSQGRQPSISVHAHRGGPPGVEEQHRSDGILTALVLIIPLLLVLISPEAFAVVVLLLAQPPLVGVRQQPPVRRLRHRVHGAPVEAQHPPHHGGDGHHAGAGTCTCACACACAATVLRAPRPALEAVGEHHRRPPHPVVHPEVRHVGPVRASDRTPSVIPQKLLLVDVGVEVDVDVLLPGPVLDHLRNVPHGRQG
eukprot:2535092-Rhodomonas_salina.3